jgi:signal peptidase II
MDLYETIPVINNFFHLTYISNDGMAFGINFPGGIYVFTAASFILTIILIGYLWYERKGHILLRIALSLIIAGAIGNFIDRALFKEVVDMFDFEFWGWHFYIFNVADSAVTVGMVFYLIYSFILQPKLEKIKSAV